MINGFRAIFQSYNKYQIIQYKLINFIQNLKQKSDVNRNVYL